MQDSTFSGEMPADNAADVNRPKRTACDKASLAGAGAVFIGTVMLYVVYTLVTQPQPTPRGADRDVSSAVQQPAAKTANDAAVE